MKSSFPCGVCKMSAKKNEDRVSIRRELVEAIPSAYFAIFDGHGGPAAAEFCSSFLHRHLSLALSGRRRGICSELHSMRQSENAFFEHKSLLRNFQVSMDGALDVGKKRVKRGKKTKFVKAENVKEVAVDDSQSSRKAFMKVYNLEEVSEDPLNV